MGILSQKPEKKYIEKYHLYYSLAIFLIIIVSIFAFNFGGGDKAGNMLGFAATLSSILLAFIAILMTIVDLTGQRNTVLELKDIASDLSDNLLNANQSLGEISELKDELTASMNALREANSENVNKISDFIEKYESPDEVGQPNGEHVEIIKDLEEMKKNLQKNSLSHNEQIINKYFSHRAVRELEKTVSEIDRLGSVESERKLRTFFSENFDAKTPYEFSRIFSKATEIQLGIPRSQIKNELKKMMSTGEVEFVNGRYYRFT